VSKKGMIRVRPMDFCFRNLRRKTESILLQETQVLCARNMGAYVRRTSSLCKRYEKRDEKLDSRAAEKGTKKLVISDFEKILE
jgi:hypothetical protein